MMINVMDADTWGCIFDDGCMIYLILFHFNDFAFAGDVENFELIACRVLLPWIFPFFMRMFGQRVGQDPDSWSIRSIVSRCCFFADGDG